MFNQLHDKSQKDTSKHLHVDVNYNKTVGERLEFNKDKTIFLFNIKRAGKMETITIKPYWLTLTGHTKGTQTSMSFPQGKVHTEKYDYSLALQSTSYGFSKVKKVNGVMCFPEFRTPTQDVIKIIDDFDERIKILQDEKQAYLNDVFGQQPLMKVVDLPQIFFDTPIGTQREAFKEILNHYGINEVLK